MDFALPPTSPPISPSSTLHRGRDQAAGAKQTTTSASSTTAANTRAPTGTTTACRGTSGRRCCARPRAAPTPPATCASRWPKQYGGKGGSNLGMAVIREHLAAKGLGLHNDLQTEHSIVGNNPFIIMFKEFATNAQKDDDRGLA